MSSFTNFDGRLYVSFCDEATRVLGKDYWLLEKEFTYFVGSLDSGVYVTVPRGFLSDGASVPAIARMFVPRMGVHSQASFLHDYLCEHYQISIDKGGVEYRYPITRSKVDSIYFEAMKVAGVSWWRRAFIQFGVNMFRWLRRPEKPKSYREKRELEEKIRLELEGVF